MLFPQGFHALTTRGYRKYDHQRFTSLAANGHDVKWSVSVEAHASNRKLRFLSKIVDLITSDRPWILPAKIANGGESVGCGRPFDPGTRRSAGAIWPA